MNFKSRAQNRPERRKLAFASAVVVFAVSAVTARSKLHAEPKGPQLFVATKEELATLRGFAQENEELQKAIGGFVKRAAKDRGVDETRFGWNSNAGRWVLEGDVVAATTSAK